MKPRPLPILSAIRARRIGLAALALAVLAPAPQELAARPSRGDAGSARVQGWRSAETRGGQGSARVRRSRSKPASPAAATQPAQPPKRDSAAAAVAPMRTGVAPMRGSVSTIRREAAPQARVEKPATSATARPRELSSGEAEGRAGVHRHRRVLRQPVSATETASRDWRSLDGPATRGESERATTARRRVEALQDSEPRDSARYSAGRFRPNRQIESATRRFRESMRDGAPHRHGPGCGHYFHGDGWRSHSKFHRHGPGCGHYHYHGGWHDFPAMHRHSAHCGHYHDGSGWIILSGHGHRHGAGCGHHYFHGRWRAYPRHYYTRSRYGSLFFFVDLGSYESRNLPRRASRSHGAGEPVDVFLAEDPLSSAYASFSDGDYDAALLDFDEALAQDPDDGLLYLARAHARIAVGDYRLAYEDLVEGMRREPDWPGVALNAAEIYSDPEDFAEHLAALEDWVEGNPLDVRARFVLGYLYYFVQDHEAALDQLERVLAADEGHEQARALERRSREAARDAATRESASPDGPAPAFRE